MKSPNNNSQMVKTSATKSTAAANGNGESCSYNNQQLKWGRNAFRNAVVFPLSENMRTFSCTIHNLQTEELSTNTKALRVTTQYGQGTRYRMQGFQDGEAGGSLQRCGQ